MSSFSALEKVKTCQIVLPRKFLGSFSETTTWGRDFFLGGSLHLLLSGKWTSADVVTLKEPVLFFSSENMVTLV